MKRALIVATVIEFFEFLRSDIELLKSLGYEVHIATNTKVNISNFTYDKELYIHHICFSRSPISRENINAYRNLKKLISKSKPEIIHCHTPVAGVLTRLAAKELRRKGTKVFYTAHGFHFYDGAQPLNWILFFPVEWLCSWWTDILITINREDYKRARKYFHAKKTKYIPGVGVDSKRFLTCEVDRFAKRKEIGISDKGFLLLSVGELNNNKNQRVVIEALRELQNKNIYYALVGDGKNRDEYTLLIKKYGLEDNIKVLGYRKDVDELCKISDCFVHPSIREGLGIAPLEGMASGLPLISSDVHGIREYTENGKSGICVKPASVEEMKKAITRMYEDAGFRERCGLYNREKAKEYDIRKSKNAMNAIYIGK